jgi:hypothetical protein
MGDALDQFSKSLASGASRRRALGALLAGSVSALPLTAEGMKNKNKKKKKLQQKFAPYQQICDDWCRINSQQPNATVNFGLCIKDAKIGKGDCFSTSKGGVGAQCVAKCATSTCCPSIRASGDVSLVECCASEFCNSAVNGTMFCE